MTVTTAGSLADHLAPVANHLAPLVAPGSLSALATVARQLPGSLTSTFGFECRLGSDRGRADFLVSVRGDRGRRGLAERFAGSADPATQGIGAFAREWSEPSSAMGTVVDNVWLEFDVDGSRSDVPSAFFGFLPSAPAAEGSRPRAERARHLAATGAALELLGGTRGGPQQLDTLARCFEAHPGAEVFQVGMMLSRTPALVRLCLRLRSVGDLVPLLRRVGWRGDEANLRRTVEPVAGRADYVCVDLDVGERVHPRVGLECYVTHGNRWPDLLAGLRSQGLCTPDEHEALLAYPGQDVHDGADPRWPPALAAAGTVLGPGWTGVVVRSLHHVKVVHHPDGPPEAKAYLAVNYRWLSPDAKVEP